MCTDCGCAAGPSPKFRLAPPPKAAAKVIDVVADLLAGNARVARENRAQFDRHEVMVVNLMSSPGAGKTALLEASIDALRNRLRVAVLEGDLATENDAERIRAHGVPAVQITTGGACHLDAEMVRDALPGFDLSSIDILFIENVGNLVCPASFDLGEHRRATLLCATEGDDKPAKYPVIYRAAHVVLLTKADLLHVLDDFKPDRARASLRNLGLTTPLLFTAARREVSIGSWLDWLDAELNALRRVWARPLSLPVAARA